MTWSDLARDKAKSQLNRVIKRAEIADVLSLTKVQKCLMSAETRGGFAEGASMDGFYTHVVPQPRTTASVIVISVRLSFSYLYGLEIHPSINPGVPESLTFDELLLCQASEIGRDGAEFHGLVVFLLKFPSHV